MTPSTLPTVSPLQYAYLEALYHGKKTAKEMRTQLSRRGVRNNPFAFYRTIRWLKDGWPHNKLQKRYATVWISGSGSGLPTHEGWLACNLGHPGNKAFKQRHKQGGLLIELHRPLPLPSITHLHFVILDTLYRGRLNGEQIRSKLRLQTITMSLSTYYEHMKRMESRGFVRGWYSAELRGERAVRVQLYEITVAGRRAVETTYDFYADRALELELVS
jgi:DNA-binding MarR family transcriptional regulator